MIRSAKELAPPAVSSTRHRLRQKKTGTEAETKQDKDNKRPVTRNKAKDKDQHKERKAHLDTHLSLKGGS